MGHFESDGYIWDKGEVPECHYCGAPAKYSTNISGIHICDVSQCMVRHCEYEFSPIEWVEED